MTQGRKSKTARALGCLLAAVFALLAFAAAPAMAQSGAESEYELQPNIPSANNNSGQPPNAGGSQVGSSGGTGANADASSAGSSSAVPTLNSDSSDDGGAPILLILLAIIAAACTGAAVWRLRQHPESSERESAPAAKPSTSATSETQSP